MTKRPQALVALVFSLAVTAACAQEAETAATERPGTDNAVAADLFGSVEDPGTGQASVPLADNASLRTLGPPRQEVDLAVLGYNSGPEGAPVRVLEFSDFGCGYCRRFHEEVFPILEEEYAETGKVEWKYVPIVIGMFPNAMEAARTGECAGEQGRFPEMRDLLFAQQREWKASNDPEPLLRGYAEEMGLEMERYDNCVEQGWQDDRILTGTQLSRQVGVRGTPTFFVVGYAPIPGAIPLDLFRQVLDTVYAEATNGSGGAN
jgi:protein-disulfide isomerase